MHESRYLDLLAVAPASWPRMTLREIGVIYAGGTPARENAVFWGGDTPWLTPGELTGHEHRYLTQTAEYITRSGLRSSGAILVPEGSLLVTTRATLGARTVAAIPMSTNQGFKNIVLHKRLADSGFMYHLFGILGSELERRASGTTFLEISGKQFGDIIIAVPPIEEQRRIAELLDTIDSRINLGVQALQKQESLASALGRELIPVLPDASLPGNEWELVPLAEVVPSTDYGISTSLATEAAGVPTLRMNNLAAGRIRLHEVKYATTSVPEHLILRDRDVLFNRTNSLDHVGRTSIWRSELPRATFASYLVRLNPDAGRLLAEYLVRWLNQPAIQQRIRRFATPGVHQVNINPTNLRRTSIELPTDLSHQYKIVNVLEECESITDRMKAELDHLNLLKQGLMEDLLTGKVRVSEAEPEREGV